MGRLVVVEWHAGRLVYSVLTYNLHLRIGGRCGIEGSVSGNFAAEISGEAKADITYKHQGCVRAALL